MKDVVASHRTLEGGASALDFQGEIDVYNSTEVKDALGRLLDEGAMQVMVSLEEVRYIDSTGLGALIEGFERLRRKGGRMVIVCTHPRIVRIFHITGLDQIIRICQNEGEALAELGRSSPSPCQDA